MPNIHGRWAGSTNELILIILGACYGGSWTLQELGHLGDRTMLRGQVAAQLVAFHEKPEPRVAFRRGQELLGLLGGEEVDSKRCGDLGFKYSSSSTARSKRKSRSTTAGERSLY